jgi:superfamily I DNA/RNA helicase
MFCPVCKIGNLLQSRFNVNELYCSQYRSGCKHKQPKNLESITPLPTPSDEQQDIFNFVYKNPNTNLLIEALAGTGKTTSLVQLVRIYREIGKTVMCLAFSKRDQEAMNARVQGHAVVQTSNAAGNLILSQQGIKVRLDDNLVRKFVMKYEFKLQNYLVEVLDAVRTYIPLNWPEIPSDSQIKLACEDIELPRGVKAIPFEAIRDVFKEVISLTNLQVYGTDFMNQVFLPVYHRMNAPMKYDVVMIDEYQDQSYLNREILRKFQGGVVVAVGDVNQAIYDWRGGDPKYIQEALGNYVSKPLTLCRRCPQAIISEAQKIVPEIRTTKEGGSVRSIRNSELIPELASKQKGYVLCCKNAPLIKIYFKCLSLGLPVVLAKSEILEQILNLINSFDSPNIADLVSKTEEWRATQLANCLGQINGDKLAESIHDRADSILAVSESVDTMSSLRLRLTMIRSNGGSIVLSTIHKSKGNEAPIVYILGEVDEPNLRYVAITRAEEELIYVA